jgi:hypothetical protein
VVVIQIENAMVLDYFNFFGIQIKNSVVFKLRITIVLEFLMLFLIGSYGDCGLFSTSNGSDWRLSSISTAGI